VGEYRTLVAAADDAAEIDGDGYSRSAQADRRVPDEWCHIWKVI
jgi:hypothetical protein